MSRPVTTDRLPSAYTLFNRLLALGDRFGSTRSAKADGRSRLALEPMEERIVLDGRPLPLPVIFAGSDAGSSPLVRAYDAETGTHKYDVTPYASWFTGGVRVGTADFTGDGIPDLVTAPGAGLAPRVKIFDGVTGSPISGPLGSFLAYGTMVDGGVYVAAADVDGDGKADVVTGAVHPNGPKIKVYSGADGSLLSDFFVPGPSFADGITVAAADLTGDGKAEIVVGGSANGRVRTYDPLTRTLIDGPLGQFQAFGPAYAGGVFVGADSVAGDVDGDGTLDLALGSATGTARVRVLSGATGAMLYDVLPFGPGVTGGARVALAYVDDDAHADIVAGSGPGTTSTVRVFSGANGAQLAAPLGQYLPFGSAQDGVFVAASNDPPGPITQYYFNGSTSTPSLVAGQSLTVKSTISGPIYTPTGTMTFTLYDSSSNVLGVWTQTLATTTAPTAATTPFTVALVAGSYTIDATYSGDSNFGGFGPNTILSVTVSAAPSNTPAPLAPGGGAAPDLVADPAGAGSAMSGYSASGVAYGTGAVTVGRSDLFSGGYGNWWGQNWSWTSALGYGDGTSGNNATLSQTAHLVQLNGDDSLSLVSGAGAAHFFDLVSGAYQARFGDTATLTHDTTNHLFIVTDGTGQEFTFYDFSGSTPSGRTGKLKKVTDAAGGVTEVTSWDGSGRPTEIQRVSGSGGSALTESFLSTYIASGTNAGLLDTVTQRTRVGTGSWSTVRSTDCDYYDGTSGPGLAGALKLAVLKDASGNTIDTSYYRYYTSGTGSSGNIQYVFGADAYGRLTADLGTSLDSLTDGQVDDYADKYLEYDSSGRVTTVVDAAAGCSVCSGGQGEFTYTYTANSSFGGLMDANVWANKTVETLPDGSTNTVYTNAAGQVMLTVFDDASTSGTWLQYTRYDTEGRVILQAGPSAVTGYSESNVDLVGYSSGNASYLDDDDGLVAEYTYADDTTATTSTAGDAAGYLSEVAIRHGETGTAIPQQSIEYIMRTAGGVDYFHIDSQTVYRNDNGTGGQTTSYDYTFVSGTNQIESVTTTLPTVTTAQNGPNSATSVVTVLDEFGRPVWSKDPSGSISYTQYDTLTGAVVKTITDVDTDNSGDFANLPSGWSSPSGKHLITQYEVDSLGRVTKTTSPEGRIDYTVYDDDNHEVRYYSGWDTTNNVATGPTTVSREDRGNGYTETLTMSATPNVSSGRPTGTESIAKVQSLSRSYVNDAGQVTHTDSYFNLAGLTYSTSASLGTQGTHFDRTEYRYDSNGQLNRTLTPQGTIYRTVYDGQGRPVSEWVGTDDTPTTGTWSPTNLTGTDMVKVREYEYDGGGVGDGNLTKVTEIPGGGATNRVTQTWFDWRNRAVAVKAGVEGSESTSVNRPLTYYDFDNLGQVTKVRMYDADTVTPSFTNDVPQPLSSSLLRAQTTTSFDELGRVYKSEVFSVDPSTGSVGSYTLASNTWFDSRGNVIKQSSPGGLVQKMVYDGAGFLTTTYLTDGGGDSGYSDADDVTGDVVLEQSETTYDDDGLPLVTLTRVRFHDASGTGALGSPSSGIGARVSYAGYYYDANSGRTTAVVDVGTNGGSAWTRPGSVPSRSDTELVTSYDYAADAVQTVRLTGSPTDGTFTLTFGGNTTSGIAYNASASTVDAALEALASVGSGNVVVVALSGGGWEVRFSGTLAGKYQSQMTGSGAGLTGGSSPAVSIATTSLGGDTGRVAVVTDPKGLVSKTYTDALGRTTTSIENWVDGVVSDGDDKSTSYTYNGAGMTSLTAHLTGGGVQTTEWVYGVTTGSGSAITSNDVVGATKWPDPSTGAASGSEQETTTVNALGQTLTMTDRNGNVHTLTYDVLGRVTVDTVTTLGSGVDGGVRRIETAYDGQGNAYLITSYDATSSGNVVNQIQRAFNGLGQMITEWQQHGAAVNTSTSPKVQYAYSEMASGANHSRLTSITYPSGYVLTFNYASGLNQDVSRLSSLSDSSGTVESYDHLGYGTVVRRGHSQPGVDLTFIGSPGDAGDQYAGLDRFGRVVDQHWIKTSGPTTTDRFQYGYDRDSNRLWRDNLVNTAMGELYGYDNLNQLTSFDRGTLNGGKTALTGSASRSQDFDFDALGNWESLTNDGGSPQTRTHNAQNEITGVSDATTPTFDANGNMTGDETGRRFVYDAWNRLVEVQDDEETTLKTYEYDGLNRRISEDDGVAMTDLYYSAAWQVLEERVDGDTSSRYVWSPVYVDAMVLRDRDTDENGSLDERLWVMHDANFNVVGLVDGSGNVVERFAYDPFGVATVLEDDYDVKGGGSDYAWTYLWQCRPYDVTSQTYDFRNRRISSTLGRPTQVDMLRFGAGDANFYRWEGNNPTGHVDPHGLDDKKHPDEILVPDKGAIGVFVRNKKKEVETPNGKFTINFEEVSHGGKTGQLGATITFQPNVETCPKCKKFRFIQIARTVDKDSKIVVGDLLSEKEHSPHVTTTASIIFQSTSLAGHPLQNVASVIMAMTPIMGGFHVDQSFAGSEKGKPRPPYYTEWIPTNAKDGWNDGVTSGIVSMFDGPGGPAGTQWNFETCVKCVDQKDGPYVACLQWGFKLNADKPEVTLFGLTGTTSPSPTFLRAMELWDNYFGYR